MKFLSNNILIFILFLFFVVEICGQNSHAEQKALNTNQENQIQTLPNISLLREKKEELDSRISFLTDLQEINSRWNDTKKIFTILNEKTKGKRRDWTYADVMDFRAKAWKLSNSLEAIAEEVSKRIEEIINYQNFWLSEERNLREVEHSLRESKKIESARALIRESSEVIESSLAVIKRESPAILQLQDDITNMREAARGNLLNLDDILKNARIALFEQNSEIMVLPKYFNQFSLQGTKIFIQNIFKIDIVDIGFLLNKSWFIFLQLLIFFIFLFTVRKNQSKKFEDEFVSSIIQRPVSLSILISFLFYLPIYRSLPLLPLFLFWFFIGIALVRIIFTKIRIMNERILISLLVFSFLFSLLFKLVNLPAYFFRLFILMAAISCSLLTFKIAKLYIKVSPIYYNSLRLSGFLLFCVFLTQLAGFSSLSLHLFDSSIKSLLLFLIVYTLIFTLKELINITISFATVQRISFVKKHDIAIRKKSMILIKIILWIIFFSFFLNIWGFFDTPTQAFTILTSFGITIGGKKITLGLAALVVAIIYLSFFVSKALQNLLALEVYQRELIDPSIGSSINRLIHYSLIVIGFFSVISILGFELKNFAILGGALGIGIGFGLQNIVNNFVSGLILLLERHVKAGDVIAIGEHSGEVVKVGLRATVVEIFDRSEMIIPNSDLVTSRVINWTRANRSIRMKLPISIAYGSNVTKTMEILKDIACTNACVLKEPVPQVNLIELTDSSIKVELLIWLDDIDNSVKTKTELLLKIEKRFREENIEIPHQKRDLFIRKE